MSFKVCNICNDKKDVSEFYARYNKCKKCMKPEREAAYQKNKDKLKDQANKRYQENRDSILIGKREKRAKLTEGERRAIDSQLYLKHREKNLAGKKEYYAANKQKIAEYRQENRGRINYFKAKSRAGAAAPKWISGKYEDEMIGLYNKARKMTEKSGEYRLYHVDHIMPLNGDGVMGLHVPWNLQIITKYENSKKRNKVIT